MDNAKEMVVDSPIGKQQVDSTGSPIGVVRMDVDKSYAGVGELLQDFINNSDQESWEKIRTKIDYTYENLDFALAPLEKETGLSSEIKSRLKRGQKLFFKPNLVVPQVIYPQIHGPGPQSTTCTEWPFIAALMRWFHDKMGIRYHQMALGEAATAMPALASHYTRLNPEGKIITTEATLEGKSGTFYGGWGFYFVRKYLAETPASGKNDNPMNGYAESVTGTYIPPGQVSDKLMIYDLNRIFDDETKGREVEVPDGINYKSITLHKVVVGGNPEDPEDLEMYPGCILVNVPKFKVHAITIFTNIIKNLGIGLYPMQSSKAGGHKWDYSVPHTPVPGMKGGIPHEVWVPELDTETGLTKRDASDNYIVNKTGGITATMIDIIKAVSNQGTFMIHIVDGIEAINLDHTGTAAAVRVPEGMVFAGLDPVATDLLCARYMFSNVPIKEALATELDDGTGGCFPQAVPIPVIEDNNIITRMDYDCPLSRNICFKKAEERGLGQRKYSVVGHDAIADAPLVSLEGHLGIVKEGIFSDLVTETLYYDMFKMPWDLQKTSFSYMEVIDQLTGSSLKKEFLEALDENGDGILDYEEFGKKGAWGALLYAAGNSFSMMSEEFGTLKSGIYTSIIFKNSDPKLNPHAHDIFKELQIATTVLAAFQMSQMEIEAPDPFMPDLTFGKGKWPSFQLADFFKIGMSLFGNGFPESISFPSLYSSAFFYADLIQNNGRFVGKNLIEPDPEVIDRYISAVLSGKEKPLDFTFFVPSGYDELSGKKVPNIEVTEDPVKIFTVSFAGGKEIWPEVRI